MSRKVALATSVIAVVMACGKGPTTPSQTPTPTPKPAGTPPATLTALKISGPSTVAPGQSVQFTATGVFSDQSTHDYTPQVSWSSYDTVLSIAPGGLATGHAVGEAYVQARFGALVSAMTVIVVPSGTYRLTGAVTESGLPVWGARVVVIGGTGTGQATNTGDDGVFRLYGVAGSVQVQVVADGYVPLTKTTVVTKNDVLDFPEFTQINSAPSLSGSFQLTIQAADECVQPSASSAGLSSAEKTRTYSATITQNGPALRVSLGGANFLKRASFGDYFVGRFQPQRLEFLIGEPYYYAYLGSGPDITEVLAPDRVLSIDGYVFWPKLTPGTLQASMQGDFSAWQLVNGSQMGQQLWDCHSTHHQFTLTPLAGAARHRRQP